MKQANYCRKLSIIFFIMIPDSLTFISLDFRLMEMADSNSALISKSVGLFLFFRDSQISFRPQETRDTVARRKGSSVVISSLNNFMPDKVLSYDFTQLSKACPVSWLSSRSPELHQHINLGQCLMPWQSFKVKVLFLDKSVGSNVRHWPCGNTHFRPIISLENWIRNQKKIWYIADDLPYKWGAPNFVGLRGTCQNYHKKLMMELPETRSCYEHI